MTRKRTVIAQRCTVVGAFDPLEVGHHRTLEVGHRSPLEVAAWLVARALAVVGSWRHFVAVGIVQR